MLIGCKKHFKKTTGLLKEIDIGDHGEVFHKNYQKGLLGSVPRKYKLDITRYILDSPF